MRITITVLLSLVLAGCATTRGTPAFHLPQTIPPGFPLEKYENATGEVYEITSSQLTVLVFREGRLKHLGHNHVLTSQMLDGLLHISDDTGFADLFLPVASFEVDNPAARALAGEGFSKQPKYKDIEGTRANLFGAKVLDALKYPYVKIHLERGLQGINEVQATVTLKGESHKVSIPVSWTVEGNLLRANSAFSLSQQALGLTPFSILGGAIGVSDELKFELTLTAQSW